MKQYKFRATSALNFSVVHNGRTMYIAFSPAYRGQSMYITDDAALAKKIMQHRWYREGRMTLTVEDAAEKAPKVKPSVATVPERKTFNLSSMKVHVDAPLKPAKESVIGNPPFDANVDEATQANEGEESEGMKAEDVSSFMEAKEYMIDNFGIARSECPNKTALAGLMKQYGVEFPNYDI